MSRRIYDALICSSPNGIASQQPRLIADPTACVKR